MPSRRDEIEQAEKGLLPDERIWHILEGCPTSMVLEFRLRLAAQCPALREKLNPKNVKYLGYANGSHSDAVYVYIHKEHVTIDVRVPSEQASKLRVLGFTVKPRGNFQGQVGWLTGWVVPYETDKLDVVLDYALRALNL